MAGSEEGAVAIIKEMLMAVSEEELQGLIARYLPQMDDTFFGVLTRAGEIESVRNPTVGARLVALARALLPLRTLI